MEQDATRLEKIEDRIVDLTARFVRDLTALQGQHLRGNSQLSSDLGSKLEAPAGLLPGTFFVRAREILERRDLPAVLDLGCGNGPHRQLIERAGCSWLGCDWDGSEDPTASARAALDGEIVKYGGKELPFATDSFDLVWSWQSLEHVQYPEVFAKSRPPHHCGVRKRNAPIGAANSGVRE